MILRDQDAVQSYLDDLLAEMPAEEAMLEPARAATSASAIPTMSAKVSTAVLAAPAAAVVLQDQVHSLEVVKRQQLQALLDRASPAEVKTIPPVVASEPVALKPETVALKPELRTVTAPSVVTAPPVAKTEPATDDEPVINAQTVPVSAESPLLQWRENGRPVWAQQKFDVLLFRVSGLTLAVPLIALGHIHPITDGLTPIFGQADWFMGLQPTPAGRIRTVNTALFVMPERYDPAFLQTARYVVSIDGLDWGLAVDQVQQPTRLDPEDVTWRSERSKRPWLAGTVKAAMCALLDVPRMGRVLESHDRKRAGAAHR